MTVEKLKGKILNKYQEGQIINFRTRDKHGEIKDRYKAKVIKFYPNFALCMVNNHKECFAHYDLDQLTTIKRGD